MARKVTLVCDFCNNPMEKVAAKVFLTPKIPTQSTSLMSNYTHSGDLCSNCLPTLAKKLDKRKSHSNGGQTSKKKSRTRKVAP